MRPFSFLVLHRISRRSFLLWITLTSILQQLHQTRNSCRLFKLLSQSANTFWTNTTPLPTSPNSTALRWVDEYDNLYNFSFIANLWRFSSPSEPQARIFRTGGLGCRMAHNRRRNSSNGVQPCICRHPGGWQHCPCCTSVFYSLSFCFFWPVPASGWARSNLQQYLWHSSNGFTFKEGWISWWDHTIPFSTHWGNSRPSCMVDGEEGHLSSPLTDGSELSIYSRSVFFLFLSVLSKNSF